MPKSDWGSGTTGALSGAASGAMIGSVVPGIGTAIGAGVGGLAGFFGGLFGGKKKKKPKRVSTLDPRQEKLYAAQEQGLYGKGEFADLYNFDANAANQNFDANVAAPAYRQFNEDVIPGITGQFRGNNLQNSTYAGESLSRAGRDVQEGLNAARSNMQYQGTQQAKQNKASAINDFLGRSTFAYEQSDAESPNGIDQILNSLGPATGKWVENYFNKPANATAAPAQPVTLK